MNKWIYSSVSLNLFAFLGFISLIIFIKPISEILMAGGSAAGDFLGFGYLGHSCYFTAILLISYLLEILVNIIFKKFAFKFPYNKIKSRFIYYLSFYTGLIWGNGILIFLIMYLFTYIYDSIFDLIKTFL